MIFDESKPEIVCTNPQCYAYHIPQAGAWRKKEGIWEGWCAMCCNEQVKSN